MIATFARSGGTSDSITSTTTIPVAYLRRAAPRRVAAVGVVVDSDVAETGVAASALHSGAAFVHP